MGIFKRKCWHLWGFWFYMQNGEFQRKTCMKCDKSRIRRTPRYIRRVSI